MYDIVIVGSGPSGSNLARLVSDKYKVLLIDKRDLCNESPTNRRNKCCGGLLAPDAQKMIAKLGLGMPEDILVDPQIFAVRTIDLTNNIERLYQRFYLNMDRERFDKWLVSLVPAKVDKKFNTFKQGIITNSLPQQPSKFHLSSPLASRSRLLQQLPCPLRIGLAALAA